MKLELEGRRACRPADLPTPVSVLPRSDLRRAAGLAVPLIC